MRSFAPVMQNLVILRYDRFEKAGIHAVPVVQAAVAVGFTGFRTGQSPQTATQNTSNQKDGIGRKANVF